jgi:flagellar motility protein MotE (MotC chaperone)
MKILFWCLVFYFPLIFAQQGNNKKDSKMYTESEFKMELKKQLEIELDKKIQYLKNTSLTQLTQELIEKERALEKRENDLNLRIEQFQLSEKGLVAKIDDIQKEKEKILGCIEDNKKDEVKRITQLVSMISGMKPDKAAGLLTVQEPSVTVRILERLESTQASKIFNSMDKEVSARLQKQFLDMRK